MALVYADSSALVKLLYPEPESRALRAFLANDSIVASEVVITEVLRAIRRAGANHPKLPLRCLLRTADELLDAIGLIPLDRALLLAAGMFDEPGLRSLDAIHLASAVDVSPLDAFVSYDERQAAVARMAGLRTVTPGR